ncbi:MAG: hypothetical protein M1836_002916 [Candelina mexicana]|nr:MAG: hypothetical protein M1836_002916 [Candelina mexicana]
MLISIAIITLALHLPGASAAAIGLPKPRVCGTEHPTPHIIDVISNLSAIGERIEPTPDTIGRDGKLLPRYVPSKIYVNTYFHIISSSSNPNQVTEKQIQAQFSALSGAYAKSNIVFSLNGVDRTVNNVWANGDDDLGMKTALRLGSYASLNVYYQPSLGSTTLGKCALPQDFGAHPRNGSYVADGCNILVTTMPEGGEIGYEMGKTTVHEVGHWFGLLHPFNGNSCDGNGDFINDTPAQSTETNGCPVKPPKDSCPGQPGYDSIHNYMDYSYDSCYEEFTPLQNARMFSMFNKLRKGK